jgi:hypothetical protein
VISDNLKKKDTVIIIPAKNEFNNLKALLKKITFQKIDIIIIDDNSNDETMLLKKIFKKILILKNKKSLGYDESIKKGLKYAKKRYSYAITMDADFEHDPKYLFKIVKNLKDGYQIVVGERNRKNRFLEILFSYFIKKFYGINDLFSGYRGVNLNIFNKDFLYKNFEMPYIVFKLHNKFKNTKNIKIICKKRIGKSRFGNSLIGNSKILSQFIKIFLQ